jgi:hypothetical protein
VQSDTRSPAIHATDLVRDIAARAVTATGLAGIALIHLLDSIGKYSETRYLFWMYVALMAGSLATSAAIGYILSRSTGLPNATGDIGNWTEPLGLASLFVEGSVVAVAASAYALVPAVRRPAVARGHRELVLADVA